MARMARSARTTGEIPDVRPPWHRRYRLLVQLGGLVVVAAVVAAVAVILSSGDDRAAQQLADRQLRDDLTPLMAALNDVAPVDLPDGWGSVEGGLGIQGNLRATDLGVATSVARGIVGNAVGFTDPDGISLLSSGMIVADSPGLALAAFERLREATPEEALAYAVSPEAEDFVSVTPIGLDGNPADRFALTVIHARGVKNQAAVAQGADPEPLLLSVTIHVAVTGRSLVYAALNTLAFSPPVPAPVDLDAWLGLLVEANQAAEQQIATEAGAEAGVG